MPRRPPRRRPLRSRPWDTHVHAPHAALIGAVFGPLEVHDEVGDVVAHQLHRPVGHHAARGPGGGMGGELPRGAYFGTAGPKALRRMGATRQVHVLPRPRHRLQDCTIAFVDFKSRLLVSVQQFGPARARHTCMRGAWLGVRSQRQEARRFPACMHGKPAPDGARQPLTVS